ncbi:MAG: hypothetical protein V4633_08545 [Pseudomonadota bacterium]
MRSSYSQLALMSLLMACGCTPRQAISEAIAQQFTRSGGSHVDLATAAPGPWEKVCILGPYSDNAVVQKTLGFAWNAEEKSTILLNDGISLLVFVQGNTVVAYVEHPRGSGDFSNLTATCHARSLASFAHVATPVRGWPGLF